MLHEPRTVSITRKKAWCHHCKGHIFFEKEAIFSMAWTSQMTQEKKIFPTVECQVCKNPVRAR